MRLRLPLAYGDTEDDGDLEVDGEQDIEEVVVVGYGTQKRTHLTGSVAKVSSEVFPRVGHTVEDRLGQPHRLHR